VIHIQGAMGSDAQLGRTGALDAAAAEGKVNLVVQQTATWDEAEAKKIVESVINSGDAFNVIYAENDGMAKGAVAALDEAGITHGVNGDVIVMGFDCNKWALRELLAGNWNYDGQCSPFQAEVIDGMIKTLEEGGEIEGLNEKGQIINEERGFDAREITEEDIATYGLGE
jgi:simple sugar transport system substrate-binding protein